MSAYEPAALPPGSNPGSAPGATPGATPGAAPGANPAAPAGGADACGSPRRAVFPGTFDPVTLGHVDLVRRAAALFDEVVVAPAAHHDKRHVFTLEERVALLQAATAGIPGVRVEPLTGLLVDGAARLGTRTVVRGVRNATDLEYERQMAHTNRAMAPWLDTVLLLSAPEHAHVSSTFVRQIARMGGDVSHFVPAHVASALRAKLTTTQTPDERPS
ncbi:MAG: pantetheine-phosphate adenylyltransferase [Planctomycetota bacterium]